MLSGNSVPVRRQVVDQLDAQRVARLHPQRRSGDRSLIRSAVRADSRRCRRRHSRRGGSVASSPLTERRTSGSTSSADSHFAGCNKPAAPFASECDSCPAGGVASASANERRPAPARRSAPPAPAPAASSPRREMPVLRHKEAVEWLDMALPSSCCCHGTRGHGSDLIWISSTIARRAKTGQTAHGHVAGDLLWRCAYSILNAGSVKRGHREGPC